MLTSRIPYGLPNVSPAYLFRKVSDDAGLPTVLFDEIDTVFGPRARDNEDLRGLLNAGHRRHATAGRCVVKGRTVETEELPAYCAVAMAGLGNLPDTILTRSVVVRMRKKAPNERASPYRPRIDDGDGADLYRRLEAWAEALRDRVAEIVDALPELPAGIVDRDADVWEPLISIANAVGGDWPSRARVAAVTLVTQSRERGDVSLGVRLLADLREVFRDAEHRSTEHLLTALHNLPEAPWGDLRGRPIDARQLANYLRQYEVRPKVLREPGVASTVRGYSRQDLYEAWLRYLPPIGDDDNEGLIGLPLQEDETSVTDVTEDNDPFAHLKRTGAG